MARVELRDIRKSFGATEVIRGLDLSIDRGEFVVFVGPSGCGKSTILRLISGLETVSSGQILFDGKDMTRTAPSRRQLAMVFQSYALFPHLTVAENIGFGLSLTKTPKAEIARRVTKVAKTLQLDSLLERTPRQLSGGQRQRVAIGRAIMRSPKVFLFDEPLSNLDAALRVSMRLEIARLHRELGDVTMIYVTHDQIEAMTLADRIVVLNGGRIEQVGTPMDVYENPGNSFVAGFVGAPSMNFIRCSVDGDGVARFGPASIHPTRPHELSGKALLGIRPEHLALVDSGQGTFDAEIDLVERLGAECLVHLRAPFLERPITVRTGATFGLIERKVVGVQADLTNLHVFPPPSPADKPDP
ncbi:ABC transporter ATP-binding protein [Achromobacter marplatensis]|uniref:ABC transporter ATP-binding protein n=1 Tax=Achromobacter marplatensis TaxID=470868 RepID=UPI003D014A74